MSTQPALPTEATLDADGRVAVDAPCASCGYNLRTLKADALCPECAQPVAFSIQGYFLRFAPPRWVRGLARGMLLVLIALGGMVVLGPVVSAALSVPMMVNATQSLPASPTRLVHLTASVQFIYHAIVAGLAIVGLWLLTRCDPAQAGRAAGVTSRQIVRLSCYLLPVPIVLNLVVALYMPVLPGFTPGGPPPTPSAMFGPTFGTFIGLGFASGLVATAVYAITLVGLVRYLISLLRRLPRPGLVRFARIEFWGLLISAATFLVGYALIAATMLPALGPLMAAAATLPSTTMPSTAPSGTVTMTSYSWSSGAVSVTQTPVPATAATAPTSATGTLTPLATLGYVAPTTAPASSLPTTLPGTPPFAPPPLGFLVGFILAGGTSALGGCGALGFGVAGIVLLVQTCVALFGAAREAESNAAGRV